MNKIALKIISLTCGVILISLSIIGVFLIRYGNEKNIKNNKETIEFIRKRILPVGVSSIDKYSNSEMPMISYNLVDYVAILQIPRLDVELPIANEWSRENIEKIPCRFGGNLYGDVMTIGGIDCKGQFDFIACIDIGDELSLTDIKGKILKYNVTAVKHLRDIEKEDLENKEYDLILFTKELKTRSYIIVQCNFK